MLATSAWSHRSHSNTKDLAIQDKESIQSFSPTLPLVYFHPNPDLEICFDTRTRTPVYALERLRPRSSRGGGRGGQESLGNNIVAQKQQRRPHFVEESNLPGIFRSRNSHYRQSGYDRGHMAPAGDFQFGQPDTFTLTNACPQHPTLNRMLWNRLEQWVRRVVEDCELLSTTSSANSTYKNVEVLVLTGPLWLPASKGPNDNTWEYRYLALGQPPSLVSVPTHFFKLVVVLGYNDDENASDDTNTRILQYAAFCVPNHGDKEMENAPLENYLVRWTDLEAVVGMQFFPRLLVGSSSDQWRILADQATEAVWKRDRLLLLLVDNGSSSNQLGKKNRRAILSANNDKLAPQHLCRHGVCK
jgi:DNA/RNA endonuclease G (NUC1)